MLVMMMMMTKLIMAKVRALCLKTKDPVPETNMCCVVCDGQAPQAMFRLMPELLASCQQQRPSMNCVTFYPPN